MALNRLGDDVVQTKKGGIIALSFPRLADPSLVKHAISTRVGGVSVGNQTSLNISYKTADESLRVEENRRLLSLSLGMDLNQAVFLTQVHSDKVFQLTAANRPAKGDSLGEGDGLITDVPNVPLFIMVADCLPVLFYDPAHKAIGLAHAGWRGTAAQVAVKTLRAMGEAFGSRPRDVRVVLGPAIGACCYEVGPDVKGPFEKAFSWGGEMFSYSAKDRWMLDIPEANARQLLEAGVSEDHLIRSNLCTVQNIDWFYSHRAEASADKPTGRFGAFMMLTGRDI